MINPFKIITEPLKIALYVFFACFFYMGCLFFYQNNFVKKRVDPVFDRVEQSIPSPVKKTAKKVSVAVGLSAPPFTIKRAIHRLKQSIYTLPSSLYNLGIFIFQTAIDRLIEAIFNPIVIFGVVALLVWKYAI